jgi:hypothetical protein
MQKCNRLFDVADGEDGIAILVLLIHLYDSLGSLPAKLQKEDTIALRNLPPLKRKIPARCILRIAHAMHFVAVHDIEITG